jgi:hypothetical protein
LSKATTSLTATYVYPTGSLQVNLSPPEAVAAGAKWRRCWTSTWLDSGAIELDVPHGPLQVEFKPLSGFLQPSIVTLTLNPAQVTRISRSYVNLRSAVKPGAWQGY